MCTRPLSWREARAGNGVPATRLAVVASVGGLRDSLKPPKRIYVLPGVKMPPLVLGLSAFLMLSVLLHHDGGLRNSAFACQCNPVHPLDRLEKSDAVFSGRVVDLAYLKHRGYVAMEVDTAWKGEPGRSVTILDDTAGGCAVGFHEGERYIMYASRMQGYSESLSLAPTCARGRAT